MTVVNTKEFNANQNKYFDMALVEEVFVKRGDHTFLLIHKNIDDMNTYHVTSAYEEILEPDEDFRSAITGEELIRRIHEDKRRNFAAPI